MTNRLNRRPDSDHIFHDLVSYRRIWSQRRVESHKSHCGKYLYGQRSFTWQPPSTRL